MSDKPLDPPPEKQVDFFLSIITAYAETLISALSQSKQIDYSGARWVLIHSKTKSGDFLKHYSLMESWDDIRQFLQRKAKFYCFIEGKQKGLVEQDYTFWVFASAQVANDYFINQLERPKEFSAQSIFPLPFIKLAPPFSEKISQILCDEKMNPLEALNRTLEILALAEWFLPFDDMEALDELVKQSAAGLIKKEVAQLLGDIRKPGASPTLLEKRLSGIFKLGWRYFRSKNELETSYFKKLLSHEPEEREKGLRLTQKKSWISYKTPFDIHKNRATHNLSSPTVFSSERLYRKQMQEWKDFTQNHL